MPKAFKDMRAACLRKGKRRTNSQWRAIGWNYQPVLPFDMWADIGCPKPAPRVFGHTVEMQRDIDRGFYS